MEVTLGILAVIVIASIIVGVLSSIYNKQRLKSMHVKCKDCQYNSCDYYDYPCYSCMYRHEHKHVSYYKLQNRIIKEPYK